MLLEALEWPRQARLCPLLLQLRLLLQLPPQVRHQLPARYQLGLELRFAAVPDGRQDDGRLLLVLLFIRHRGFGGGPRRARAAKRLLPQRTGSGECPTSGCCRGRPAACRRWPRWAGRQRLALLPRRRGRRSLRLLLRELLVELLVLVLLLLIEAGLGAVVAGGLVVVPLARRVRDVAQEPEREDPDPLELLLAALAWHLPGAHHGYLQRLGLLPRVVVPAPFSSVFQGTALHVEVKRSNGSRKILVLGHQAAEDGVRHLGDLQLHILQVEHHRVLGHFSRGRSL
mmetsp:Transcript_30939/g.73239  ORF Transcript_30939/g.73239 Transcript_30939/m.73239 type:complete len:285 (+) Transcript_30939:597-1451(+)